MKFTKRFFHQLCLAGTACCALWLLCTFMLGITATFIGWPSILELPWSDFGDFVESTDGRVYVQCRFYSHILCYDTRGKFLSSLAYTANAKDTKLAAAKTGEIYLRSRNTVYTYTPEWKLISTVEDDPAKNRSWKLDADARPIRVDKTSEIIPNRPIGSGELLFSESQERVRDHYNCNDGSVLYRSKSSIRKISPDGTLLCVYQPPFILRLLQFPSAIMIAVPLGIAFFILTKNLAKH